MGLGIQYERDRIVTLANRWGGLFPVGRSVRRRRTIGPVTLSWPTTTRTADAGIVIALTGRCYSSVFVGKSSFKLKIEIISPHPNERI